MNSHRKRSRISRSRSRTSIRSRSRSSPSSKSRSKRERLSNRITRKQLLSSLSKRVSFDESILFSENEIIPKESVSLFCNTHGSVSLNINRNIIFKRPREGDIPNKYIENDVYNYKYVNPHFFDPFLKLHRFIKTSKGAASFTNINEDNNIYKRLMYKNNIFSKRLFSGLKYSDFEIKNKPNEVVIDESNIQKLLSNLYKPIDFNNTLLMKNDILINNTILSKSIYKKLKQKYNEKYNVNRVLNKTFSIEPLYTINKTDELTNVIKIFYQYKNRVISFRDDVTIIFPFFILNENINEYIIEKLNTFPIFKKINVEEFLNQIYYKIGIPEFFEENAEYGKRYKIKYEKGTNILSCPYFISYLLEAFDENINDIYPNLIFSNSFDPIPSGKKLEYYTHLCVEYPQLIVEVGGIPLTKYDYYPYFQNEIILSSSKTIRTLMVDKVNLQSLLVYLQGNDKKSVYMVDYSCDLIKMNREQLILYRKIENQINMLIEKQKTTPLTNIEKTQIRKYENMIRLLEDQTIRGGGNK